MAYFPGTQSFRQPYPRKRTKQGGDNRRATTAYGTPNLMARGMPIPGRQAGNRTENPFGWSQGNAWWKQQAQTPPQGGRNLPLMGRVTPGSGGKEPFYESRGTKTPPFPGPQDRPSPGDTPSPGPTDQGLFVDPNRLYAMFQSGDRRLNPLEHQQLWASRGYLWNPNQEQFVQRDRAQDIWRQREQLGGDYEPPPGGGGGGNGGGGDTSGGGGAGGPGAGGIDWDNLPDDMNWGEVLKGLGLPLDPMFAAQESNLRGMKDLLLSQSTNAYDTGKANLDLQNVLANRSIDEQMAARGLFGSGVENRSERLQGNDYAQGMLALLENYKSNQLGAKMDYRTGLMQAIMDLGNRSLADPYSPIPNWNPNQQQGGGVDARIARLREMLQSGDLNQNQRTRIRDRIQGLR